jgi:succinate-semialdehyde dehydrogenase/glutarate-semialdehyde dehydrogenase
MIIKSYNPSNNTLLGQVKSTELFEIKEIVSNSKLAFQTWKNLTIDERLDFLKNLYNEIKYKKEEFSELLTSEMGIPISEALLDIDSGLEYIKWYIDNAREILEDKITYEDAQEIDKIIFEPKGTVAVIIAWNFPFSSFVWQAVSNLVVGNTVVIKHSEYVPLCSKYIYDMVSKIFPKDVYSVVYGDVDVGKELVKQDIDMICFTGSTKVGQELYKVAAEKFIPIILECGGSAPGIVFDDVNIDSVIESIYINKFSNTGQICDGQKRLIVHESKFDELCDKLKAFISNKKIGNPLDKEVEIGPLANKSQLEKIDDQVQDAIKKGAKVICGGEKIDLDNGNYYMPTILTNITKDMKVYREEVFGPVIPIIKFNTIEEAIEIANDTQYGLGGYVYTSNKTNYNTVVKNLRTGMIALNNLYYLRPCNPFGGYKKSGMGKNNSEFGLRELCNIKVVTYEK